MDFRGERRVIVTGGPGFLGGFVAEILKAIKEW